MTQWRTIYRLVLRIQVTRGRVVVLGLLGLLGMLLGLLVGITADSTYEDAVRFVSNFALGVFAPIATLLFAIPAFGDPVEDGTLVYLWLRPVPRWQIALAAWAATLTVSGPIVLVPVVASAALTQQGGVLIGAATGATALALVAYSGVFVFAGLRLRRALIWGLAYILLWEGFVARAGRSAARFAILAYTRTVLTDATGVKLKLSGVSIGAAIMVPLAVGVAAIALTTRRLIRQEVA